MCIFYRNSFVFYAPMNAGKIIWNYKFTINNKLKVYFYHKFVRRK